jgi:hypothetical protein
MTFFPHLNHIYYAKTSFTRSIRRKGQFFHNREEKSKVAVVAKEKEAQWAQMVERCRRVVDRLGKPIRQKKFNLI